MRSRIKKWGNSLALRIPKPIADEIGLQRDVPIDLSLRDGKLLISPIVESKITLDELLEQVTEDNIHGEVETGPAVGKEVW
ncbi:AbrB/MazE/SpoVT family DNA-binding domain-containing protein [Candidatus Bipolaricaulota bacterium]|jgi:antitoxin MazE|nr:AbrB/MazE/SpoVT family DNA-binding domain-containing protein [Candidatus Bipolaricaulota bacterium]